MQDLRQDAPMNHELRIPDLLDSLLGLVRKRPLFQIVHADRVEIRFLEPEKGQELQVRSRPGVDDRPRRFVEHPVTCPAAISEETETPGGSGSGRDGPESPPCRSVAEVGRQGMVIANQVLASFDRRIRSSPSQVWEATPPHIKRIGLLERRMESGAAFVFRTSVVDAGHDVCLAQT